MLNDDTDQDNETGEPTPDTDETSEPGGDMAPGQICVPLSSLAIPDEKEQMTPPEVGDKGQANIEYTVNKIDGENAYVTLDAVNGNKLEDQAPANDEDELSQLQGMASQMPART